MKRPSDLENFTDRMAGRLLGKAPHDERGLGNMQELSRRLGEEAVI